MYHIYLINGDFQRKWKAFLTIEDAKQEQQKLLKFGHQSIIKKIIK